MAWCLWRPCDLPPTHTHTPFIFLSICILSPHLRSAGTGSFCLHCLPCMSLILFPFFYSIFKQRRRSVSPQRATSDACDHKALRSLNQISRRRVEFAARYFSSVLEMSYFCLCLTGAELFKAVHDKRSSCLSVHLPVILPICASVGLSSLPVRLSALPFSPVATCV